MIETIRKNMICHMCKKPIKENEDGISIVGISENCVDEFCIDCNRKWY